MFGTNKINTFYCWEYDFKMFPKKGLERIEWAELFIVVVKQVVFNGHNAQYGRGFDKQLLAYII